MELEQLSLGPAESAGFGDGPDDAGGVNGGDDGVRAQRLPRWTRQEILVLVQGKRVAEGRVRRGRVGVLGGGEAETKWASVSSYCRRYGVNRGPIQCRKRWSNLSGDFKKIREWEEKVRGRADLAESFWVMRNDLRRERRLPGFFDREVYDILDRGAETPAPVAVKQEEDDPEDVIFDSGRSAAAEDGLFSDFEQEEGGDNSRKNWAVAKAVEVQTPTPLRMSSDLKVAVRHAGASSENRKRPNRTPEPASREGWKRKRPVAEAGDEEAPGPEDRLIEALERNGRLLKEQVELQDRNSRLDRDQKRDQTTGLFAVLDKLADALGKIADKL
ncbi:hypothetical protein SAY87_015710 [Trapa incisa]|uniref:Myb-like domain-containing protein n=1 Tax=Trapa incisa TaxID=236973 RepID=A0AAN7L7X7_9MYRT|nr:hypothetical protein SAY87_015710 [Trapa incisa]